MGLQDIKIIYMLLLILDYYYLIFTIMIGSCMTLGIVIF